MGSFKLKYTGQEVDTLLEKADGLTQVNVATSITSSGTDPVTSKAIYNALSKKADTSAIPSVDSSLSTSSTRAVQNKVVTTKLNDLDARITMNAQTYYPEFEAVYGGEVWSLAVSNTTTCLRDVCYGKDKFIAVGDEGLILLADNSATEWNAQTSNITTTLYGVIFGNNEFIALGAGGIILHSVDGIIWENIANEYSDITFQDACWDGEAYYIIGSNSTILRTTDLTNFTKQTCPIAKANLLSIECNENVYIATCKEGVIRSEDGYTWTKVITDFKIDGYSSSSPNPALAYGNGVWIVGGYTDTNGGGSKIIRSLDDGLTWSIIYNSDSGNHIKTYGFTYGGNQFVAVGWTGGYNALSKICYIRLSPDGASWTDAPNTKYSVSTYRECFWDACCGNNLYVAVGAEGKIAIADASFSMSGLKVTTPTISLTKGFSIKVAGVKYTNNNGATIDQLPYTTLNINSLGAKKINGILEYGKVYTLIYNGESWDIEGTSAFLKQEIIPGETMFNLNKNFACIVTGILANDMTTKIVVPNAEITLLNDDDKNVKVSTTNTTISFINNTEKTYTVIYSLVD